MGSPTRRHLHAPAYRLDLSIGQPDPANTIAVYAFCSLVLGVAIMDAVLLTLFKLSVL